MPYKLGHFTSEETRRKIGEANKISLRGRKLSQEHKTNISKGIAGEHNPFYGKHHSDETKKKIGMAGIGRVKSEETKRNWR